MAKLKFVLLILLFVPFNINGQSIDTLHSYTEFKLYNGNNDTVYIDHPRYFGLFTKDTCSSSNFATTIESQNGCYKRIESNMSPRYFEIGSASPLPILGGTIVNEVDAINAAAFIAYDYGGGTVMIDTIYTIDRSVYLFDNVTYLGKTENTGFKRSDPPVTILRQDAKVGENKIIVESTEGFRKFHKINIFSGRAYDQLSSFSSYTASVSTFLGGDSTLFLSGLKIQRDMNQGDTVSLLYPMMVPLFGTSENVVIKNLIFDGNRENNGFSYDWRVGTSIVSPSSKSLLIDNCSFINIPSENIFMCGATLINCTGSGLNGSLTHFSCLEGDFETQVLYNQFENTNEIGDLKMEHSEASMTFSAKVRNLRVAYNNVLNVSENGIGVVAQDDYNIEITDNQFSTEKESAIYSPFYSKDSLNTVYNNKNISKANMNSGPCLIQNPEIFSGFDCEGFSDTENALKIGDSLVIVFDSISVLNSNENFLKCIEPNYNEEYFSLTEISLKSKLSRHHKWVQADGFGLCKRGGLVFDNGHRDGIYGNGNWGYEGCSFGDCVNLKLVFVVHSLPASTSIVNCPLESLNIKFDSEVETWSQPITCTNLELDFDGKIGSPYLSGTSNLNDISQKKIQIFPVPSLNFIAFSESLAPNSVVQILDHTGRKIGTFNGITSEIDISSLIPGIYFLNFTFEGKSHIQKFVKL